MATLRQIKANRRNAQKSTGPRTPEGKAVACFNALKHGIDAKSHCLPTEDPDSLEHLTAEYHERFAPATPEARALIDALIACEWELRRLRQASAELWQMSADERTFHNQNLPMADSFLFEQTPFVRLQRIMDATYRNYRNALKTLQQLPPAPPTPPQPEESKPATAELASFRKHAASEASHPSPSPIPDLPSSLPVPPLTKAGTIVPNG